MEDEEQGNKRLPFENSAEWTWLSWLRKFEEADFRILGRNWGRGEKVTRGEERKSQWMLLRGQETHLTVRVIFGRCGTSAIKILWTLQRELIGLTNNQTLATISWLLPRKSLLDPLIKGAIRIALRCWITVVAGDDLILFGNLCCWFHWLI
jgi:hypothetical protein